jgi:four helix bundle protein
MPALAPFPERRADAPPGASAPAEKTLATAASAAVAASDEALRAATAVPETVAADDAACREAAASAAADEAVLDANKLHVYRIALELHALCSTLVAMLHRIVRDQLERASLSVVLNIAEAGGRRSRRDKARYYMIARGSATEVAALLDVLTLRRLAPSPTIRAARRLAVRCVQKLTKMHEKLS